MAGRVFRKSGKRAMLEAEAEGVRALASTGTIRVPGVVRMPTGHGSDDDDDVLELEWLDLRAPDREFGKRFGTALARLHMAPPPVQGFGWPRDNFIGLTPQRNTITEDWLEFYSEHRLRAMTERLSDSEITRTVEQVIDRVDTFFADGYVPRRALIHGDLWSGNWGMLPDGTPVIYDPAVSCSDPESELAMMELFGSPPAGFFDAYRASAGLHPGYGRHRRSLYQLYHLLNHALLFGGAYRAQALRCARSLLR